MRFRRFLPLAVFGVLLLCIPSRAATFTVTNLNDSGSGSLRQTIASANATAGADTITFAVTGILTLTSGELLISDGVTIKGPGAGSLTVSGNNSSRVFKLTSGLIVAISGLTLANGRGSNASAADGGAIYNGGSRLTLTNCTFTNNVAGSGAITGLDSRGGAIFNSGQLSLTGCTLVNNIAGTINFEGGKGGAIFNSASLTLNNCTFSNNRGNIAGSGWSHGGAVYNDAGGSATLFNCTFSGNVASVTDSGYGGAVFNNAASLACANCTLSGNQASIANQNPNVGGYGGAIFTTGGNATLFDCTLNGNVARSGIDNAAGYGGAVDSINSNLTLANCTLSGNTANGTGSGYGGGGAVRATVNSVTGGRPSLTNCTIAGNNAGGGAALSKGGGLYLDNVVATLRNTIVAGNTAGTGPDIVGTLSATFSLIQNAAGWSFAGGSGNNLIGLDPNLGPLQNNGGPTQTRALSPGSPAINAGDTAVLSTPPYLSADQRDFPRRIGGAVDIGAYEADLPQSGPNFVVNTLDEHSDHVCGEGDCSLWDAANAAGANPDPSTITFKAGLSGTITTALQNTGIHISAPVTIQGPGARVLTISGGNVARVFYIMAGTVAISGLTIANGRVQGANEAGPAAAGDGNGGGIRVDGSGTLTLTNCTLSGNATIGGAGLFGGGGAARGGGIYNTGTLTLRNCTLSANSAVGGSGGFFGGTGGASFGGGLYSTGSATLTNCTLSGNSASGGRGGDASNSNTPGQGGEGSGGGILSGGTATLTLCTLGSNTAKGGVGGINDDFTFAPAGSGNGGGLYPLFGTATVRGSILALNTATNGANVFGAVTSRGYNLIGTSSGSSGFSGPGDQVGVSTAQVALGTLGNNGGATDTRALLAGSRAVDAGKAFGATTDQRGKVRPSDDAAIPNVGDGSDIGAYERGAGGLAISDVTVTEGAAGATTTANFTVTLLAPSTQTVTVSYATADNTASASSDYIARSGTLTFNPGQTFKTVAVTVRGDDGDETNTERFFVNLSNAVNASIVDAQGIGTITDDDALPVLLASDAVLTEGNSGSRTVTLTLRLSAPSGRKVTVDYATADGTATVADGDYVAQTGTVEFAPGQTSKAINVTVNGDVKLENDEAFFVNLSHVNNATPGKSQGQVTIANDDTAAPASVADEPSE